MTNSALADTRPFDFSTLKLKPRFKFKIGEKQYDLTFQDAFTYAHGLSKNLHLASAIAIFDRISSVVGEGLRAKIMLAHCHAKLSNFEQSKQLLDTAFPQDLLLAQQIQDAFVYETLGVKHDALEQLVQLVNSHKELPTLCLLLGDMLETKKRYAEAQRCWQLAIKRDSPDGAVAIAAQKQFTRLETAIAMKKEQRG